MNEQVAQSDIEWFCRQVRARSSEHRAAMGVAHQRGWHSIAVGILRQELDSMVRVIFLLSQCDYTLRATLLAQAVSGEPWRMPTGNGKLKRVTDREMIDLAKGLQGWAQLVYRFGCSFIHLSHLHDYQARDPFRSLLPQERQQVVAFLHQYHTGDPTADSAFADIVAYAPKILDKIATNLERYLYNLEHGLSLP